MKNKQLLKQKEDRSFDTEINTEAHLLKIFKNHDLYNNKYQRELIGKKGEAENLTE